MARPGRQDAPRASPSLRSAMPTGCCAPRAASTAKPGGAAIVAGKRCPIVGHISMDLVCIDVTDLPDAAVHRGDVATFIGEKIFDRRSRRIRRHDRLRNPDPARPALPSRLSRRLRTVAMVARAQNFVCQSCGAASARWAGRCEACGAWNTLVEEGAAAPARAVAQGPPVRHRAAQRAKRWKRPGSPPASPNSIASPAAVWCAARCCCSAAIPASANRRC